MRMTLESRPGEVAEKREELLRALSERFLTDDPEMADRMYKAMDPPHVTLEHRALRELQAEFRAGYERVIAQARRRIDAILESGDPDPPLKSRTKR